jgi:2-keto-4-pentenoate hydratase/2-oxohepta-3-ene-1,7-dioic acid hydratase in catechol pathway
MKLALFDDFIPGLVHGDRIIDLRDVIGAIAEAPPAERLPRLIANFERLRPALEQAGERAGVSLEQVRLRPPLPRPSKIFCCIGNYKEGVEAPLRPLDMFLKSSDAVIGPDDTVELPPVPATIFHHEAELAVVIGQRAKRVAVEEAMAHVFGYTCFIDVSARGIGQRSFIGKSFDTFAPLGPWIVTTDEVGDPQRLQVRLWVDGQPRHDYNTEDMEHPVAEVVAWASQVAALAPGDVIACGTNHQGIGPIQDGEVVEIEIERIGRMRVRVRDPRQRRWPKGVDEAMARRVREGRLAPQA